MTSPDMQCYKDPHRNTEYHVHTHRITKCHDIQSPRAPSPAEGTPQMSQHTELWCLPRRSLYGGIEISGFQSQQGWSSPFPSPSPGLFPPLRAQGTP